MNWKEFRIEVADRVRNNFKEEIRRVGFGIKKKVKYIKVRFVSGLNLKASGNEIHMITYETYRSNDGKKYPSNKGITETCIDKILLK